MIRMQISERMIFEAQQLMEDLTEGKSTYWTEATAEERLIGAIGEVAFIDYCWSNDLLAHKNDSFKNDVVLFSGHTIEVKTQKVSSVPQMHYRVNFSADKKESELSDFIFFNRVQFVAGRAECVWLLGGCSWDKVWRLSDHHLYGDPMIDYHTNGDMTASGRYFSAECYDLAISQLAPPSATLKHFKSLQEKEEAQ